MRMLGTKNSVSWGADVNCWKMTMGFIFSIYDKTMAVCCIGTGDNNNPFIVRRIERIKLCIAICITVMCPS